MLYLSLFQQIGHSLGENHVACLLLVQSFLILQVHYTVCTLYKVACLLLVQSVLILQVHYTVCTLYMVACLLLVQSFLILQVHYVYSIYDLGSIRSHIAGTLYCVYSI